MAGTEGSRAREPGDKLTGQPHSLIGHDDLFRKEKAAVEVPITTPPKASLTKTAHSPTLPFLALSLRPQRVTHCPYLLGSIGVPQPAHKKFWVATTSSFLHTEKDHSYSSEIANRAFFTDWTRN